MLVVMQIGLCVVLLSGASLLVRSFWNLEQQNLGMQTRNVMTVHVPLNWEQYPSGLQDFYLRAEAALRQIPGVTAVGMSDSLPPDGWHDGCRYADLEVAGKPPHLPERVGLWFGDRSRPITFTCCISLSFKVADLLKRNVGRRKDL